MNFKNRFEACDFLRQYYATNPDKKYYCYMLCTQDGKPFYIGISRSWKRLHSHEKETRDVNFLKERKIKSIRKNGGEITYRIVRFFTNSLEVNHAERSLILFYGQIIDGSGILTNLTTGGDGRGGLTNSEKQKEAARKANSKPKSEETKKKLSDSVKKTFAIRGGTFTGKKHTEETKQKMSIARKSPTHSQNNMKGEQHFNYGKRHSPETLLKIAESLSKIDTSCSAERKQSLKEYYASLPVLTCEHCGKQMRHPAPFKKYHGENCKNNQR